jgi:hypothetical protein
MFRGRGRADNEEAAAPDRGHEARPANQRTKNDEPNLNTN